MLPKASSKKNLKEKKKNISFFGHIVQHLLVWIQKYFLLFTSRFFEEVQKHMMNIFIPRSLAQMLFTRQGKLVTAGARDPVCFLLEWEDLKPHNKHPGRTAVLQSLLNHDLLLLSQHFLFPSLSLSSLLLHYASSGLLHLSLFLTHPFFAIYS